MKLSDFDYNLPESFIAQTPAEPRDAAKLLHLNASTGVIHHRIFRELPSLLRSGDVLVMNNTRVLPARLQAAKAETGGKVEILLLRQQTELDWQALVGGRNVNQDTVLALADSSITAHVMQMQDGSKRVVRFSEPIEEYASAHGAMPLPPYIHTTLDDAERYQTVYSRSEGSAAAPTAGLHFTPELLLGIREMGVQLAYCTLHVGLDTFQPVRVEQIEDHVIHSEYAELTATNANIINQAKLAGGRVIAVGTTSARTLETAGILSEGGDPANPAASDDRCPWRPVIAFEQDTRLFITPGYRWRVVDAMITNFHLPKSTLLMMLSALVGREQLLQTYELAKDNDYRFFSFGDAMFIEARL